MAFNIKGAIAKAAATTDMNVAQKGGGTYTPPAEGKPGLRFVSYIELGQQLHKGFQGAPDKYKDTVKLGFELHGKKWPIGENGRPTIMTLTLPKSQNEKAAFFKLFKQMNYSGKYKHMAEMLGEDFSGQVYQTTKGEGADAKVYAGLKDPASGVLAITAPFTTDPNTDEDVRRNIPPAITELRCFLFDYPDKDQWASIYIEGTYDDGKSKNVFQDAIKASKSFPGSAVEAMLLGGTDDDDDTDDVEAAKAAAKEKKAAAAKAKADKPKADKPKKETTPPAATSDDDDDPLANIGGDDE